MSIFETISATPPTGGTTANEQIGRAPSPTANRETIGNSQAGQTIPGVPNAPPAGLSSADQSVWAQVEETLQGYGFNPTQLGSLMNFVQQELVNGDSSAQIGIDLQLQPAFAERFPAIAQRQQNGLPPISVADYLSTETAYAQAETAAGISPNYASYDQLIASDVSPTEYSDRLTQGYLAVANADPTVVQAMQDYYGVTPGQMAEYFLNPDVATPKLLQQAVSAQIGGAATQSGYNGTGSVSGASGTGLSQSEALRLAQMGVSQTQAQTGFATIARQQQLTGTLPGQGQQALTQDQVLNAQFGSDGASAEQISQNEALQKGFFAQGTQVGQTSTGLTGIGTVQR